MAGGEGLSFFGRTLYDMHVHSDFSPDSDTPMADMCRRAVELGLDGICFTDHAEFAPGDHIPGAAEMRRMGDEVRRLRSVHRDNLSICLGIEIGYYRGAAGDIVDFLDAYDFDFILGSVHVSGETCYSFPRSFDPGHDPMDYFSPYLRDLASMVDEVDFDALGHFDLPKRYGPAEGEETGLVEGSPLWDTVVDFLGEIVDRGKLLEINASGLRQNAKRLYPSGEILRAYRSAGGEAITLGSDSHATPDLGFGMEMAMAAAREAGIARAARFSGRRASYYCI